VQALIKAENGTYREYKSLPLFLRDPRSTHPADLYRNMKKHFNGSMSSNDKKIYRFMQSLFNYPPIFTVRMGDYLIPMVFSLNEKFDSHEMRRVKMIYELWKSDLMRGEFGFRMEPKGNVIKVGFNGVAENPDVTWELIYQISSYFTGENSRISQLFSEMIAREDAPKLAKVIPLFGRKAA
jgi:hypothetical protein